MSSEARRMEELKAIGIPPTYSGLTVPQIVRRVPGWTEYRVRYALRKLRGKR